MQMAKRIFLLITLNMVVMITLMAIIHFLGIGYYVTAQGIDLVSLAAFCLVWGFGGAFISLAMSKMFAKWTMGVKVIEPNTRDPYLRSLVERVHGFARRAGINKMPEVGIYQSAELNAFATGPTKNRALVAVSSGLLQKMSQDEVDGVLGHEISHVANGDMVTMTLVQGVVNAFVMFIARILGYAAAQALRGDRERASPFIQMAFVFFFEFVLMFAGMIVVAWVSRLREYRADAGGARLAGKEKMIAALEGLRRNFGIQDPVSQGEQALQTLKISGQPKVRHLFSTHPSLELRIQRLQDARVV